MKKISQVKKSLRNIQTGKGQKKIADCNRGQQRTKGIHRE